MKKLVKAVAAGAAGAILLARSEYERKQLETVEYEIFTDKLSKEWDGYSIVFLSDLHDNCFGSGNSELLSKIQLCNPKLVLIGGDMPTVKRWRREGFDELSRLLMHLTEKYPVYYALGNHEQRMREEAESYPGWWKDFYLSVRQSGAKFLINNSARIESSEGCMVINGITLSKEFYKKGHVRSMPEGYISRRLGKADEHCFNILLAHNPLFFDRYAAWGADLTLAGHFHGGTIRIPGLGGLMTPQLQFFSPYARGRLTRGKAQMIVSGGLGTHSINVRICNLPQLINIIVRCNP